jgi:hypothetical protein
MANNDDFELIPQERLDASLTGTSFLELYEILRVTYPAKYQTYLFYNALDLSNAINSTFGRLCRKRHQSRLRRRTMNSSLHLRLRKALQPPLEHSLVRCLMTASKTTGVILTSVNFAFFCFKGDLSSNCFYYCSGL